MEGITAHVINHTHWDREWFLTSIYTSRWIGGLIDRLAALAEENPDFHFFLDGQTLVIEDLLGLAPHYRETVDRLVRGGSLLIGPYYCQPDWRLTGGEALLRNFLWGRQDGQQHGGGMETGWLVDTFGHISQAPQLHRLFGINAVYIWRGASELEPYFDWRGADGTHLFTTNLFGGYRNLYGVTHVPEIAAKRLLAELQRLRPYYPTADIPLFDGYDLEDNPEDPVRFYGERRDEIPPDIQVAEATPSSFAERMRSKLENIPVVSGEMMSGKFGAVFPGTLSARTYLKVMARDCEHLLYQACEPLGALACLKGRAYPAEQYEAWSRLLLQNAVHDCICGVSIDQVHEKMEYSYRQTFEAMLADIHGSLEAILQDFAPGEYAASTNPFPYDGYHIIEDRLYHVQTHGIGVWKITESHTIQEAGEPVESFTWKNGHYEARVHPDGRVQVGEAVLGALLVRLERGDTYSDEAGPILGELQPDGPLLLEQQSDRHCVLSMAGSASLEGRRITARLRLTFDQSSLIRWQVELDSRGTDFQVEMVFDTGHPGQIYAGMPFDIVSRPAADPNHLPRQLEPDLAAVLLGQRELGATRTFPFHDFVAVSDGEKSTVVLAKGLHAYQASEDGRITLPLRRSVEWLTKPDLENRVGDAGPFFYVPDARGERTVTHELAFAQVNYGVEDSQLQALNAGFQNPPWIVTARTSGAPTDWPFFQENLPLSSLHLAGGQILARVYNPASQPYRLSKAYPQTDGSGQPQGTAAEVPPKAILTLALAEANRAGEQQGPRDPVTVLNSPAWRVGPNQGLPDPSIIDQLKAKIHGLAQQTEALGNQLAQASGRDRYRLQHQLYVLERELLEYRLSARLNEIKLAQQGRLTYDYLYQPDPEIEAIGRQLNALRIKRRIYDYVIQAV